MPTITINGVTISAGRNIVMRGNRIVVDGVDVTPDAKVINVTVAGNVERIEADAPERIVVTGDVGSIATQSGDVVVSGEVRGSVSTMSGDVEVDGSVAGSVSTMSGNVKHR